jgi:hypothetical protein
VSNPKRVGDPTPIGELLPAVLRGIKGPPGHLERVRKAWGEIVGPLVASRTRVAGVENGQVRVEVASAALKHDLATFRQPEVLKGLQERLPEMGIRGVSYRVAAVP